MPLRWDENLELWQNLYMVKLLGSTRNLFRELFPKTPPAFPESRPCDFVIASIDMESISMKKHGMDIICLNYRNHIWMRESMPGHEPQGWSWAPGLAMIPKACHEPGTGHEPQGWPSRAPGLAMSLRAGHGKVSHFYQKMNTSYSTRAQEGFPERVPGKGSRKGFPERVPEKGSRKEIMERIHQH